MYSNSEHCKSTVPYKLAVKKKTFFFDCTVNHKIIIALTILWARIVFYVMLLTLSEGNYYFWLLLRFVMLH
jgi:hypothetical protein